MRRISSDEDRVEPGAFEALTAGVTVALTTDPIRSADRSRAEK